MIALDEIAVTNGRFHVMRDRDGRLNLPASSETPSGEPAPINIAHLSAPRLLVDVKDAQNDLSLAAPGITLDIGRGQGRVALNAPARGREETDSHLHAGRRRILRWARSHVGGSLTAIRGDVTATGRRSVAAGPRPCDRSACARDRRPRAARAIEGGELPRGTIAFDVHATGTFADASADLRVTSTELNWTSGADPSGPRLRAVDVTATARMTSDALNLQNAQFTLADGSITATGRIPFGDEPAHVNASSRRDIDATAMNERRSLDALRRRCRCAGGAGRRGRATQLPKSAPDVVLRAPMAADP